MLKRIIKFFIVRYYKKHNFLSWSIPVDERTSINILVGHYYDGYWTYGTKVHEYERDSQKTELKDADKLKDTLETDRDYYDDVRQGLKLAKSITDNAPITEGESNVLGEVYVPTEEEFVSAEKYNMGRADFIEVDAHDTYHNLVEQKCYGDIWAVVSNARYLKDDKVLNKCYKCAHYKGDAMEDEFDICDNLSPVMRTILCDFVETGETDDDKNC